MGLAIIDDALRALLESRPVVVSGLGLSAPAVLVFDSTEPLPLGLAELVGAPTEADTTRSSVVSRSGPGVAGDLCRMCGGTTLSWAELRPARGAAPPHSVAARLVDDFGLVQIDAGELIHHLWSHEELVRPVGSARLPMRGQSFTAHVYRGVYDDTEHMALTFGSIVGSPLVRVHSECLTGDLFGSQRCDCGAQLEAALSAIVQDGAGVLVYVRNHEGRGIGLADKIRAYGLQDEGLDTIEANEALGHPADARHYGAAAQILGDLGVTSVRLMTNNPRKLDELSELGVTIAQRISLQIVPNGENDGYLETKRTRFGHFLDD
jgi:3,4-dihydroxy 2-butanone 4-phosphate synthase/GTP cyclohydrolase II